MFRAAVHNFRLIIGGQGTSQREVNSALPAAHEYPEGNCASPNEFLPTILTKEEMKHHPKAAVAATVGLISASVAAIAILNRFLSQKAERENPPQGDFLEVQGVRLHYVARGNTGPWVIFLHGNGSMIQDFDSSGILTAIAHNSRVMAFDRPGYGYSSRPKEKSWAPHEQARLFSQVFDQLGIERPVVVGHSWGALVALELALKYREKVAGLVLASGYYIPTARPDVLMGSIGAVPWLGRILCHTILPIVGRISWPLATKNLFSPCAVPAKFKLFPTGLALRPSQMRASAEESALMVPSTEGLLDRSRELDIPVAIISGAGDQVVDPQHSAKLNRVVTNSSLSTLLFNGHMVHHTALKEVSAMIEDVQRRGNVR